MALGLGIYEVKVNNHNGGEATMPIENVFASYPGCKGIGLTRVQTHNDGARRQQRGHADLFPRSLLARVVS